MKYPFIKMNLLLYLMEYGEMTGYSFMKYCKQRGLPISNGTIYPHLKDLESGGLIEGEVDGKRKVYKLTPYGKEWIENSTNGTMPERLKRSYMHLFRSFDMTKWDNLMELNTLLRELEHFQQALTNYIQVLEKQNEGGNTHGENQ